MQLLEFRFPGLDHQFYHTGRRQRSEYLAAHCAHDNSIEPTSYGSCDRTVGTILPSLLCAGGDLDRDWSGTGRDYMARSKTGATGMTEPHF